MVYRPGTLCWKCSSFLIQRKELSTTRPLRIGPWKNGFDIKSDNKRKVFVPKIEPFDEGSKDNINNDDNKLKHKPFHGDQKALIRQAVKKRVAEYKYKYTYKPRRMGKQPLNRWIPEDHPRTKGIQCPDLYPDIDRKTDYKWSRPRANPVGVQHISKYLNHQIFGGVRQPYQINYIELARTYLKSCNLDKAKEDPLPHIAFDIPPLEGLTVEDHFYYISNQFSAKYIKRATKFAKGNLAPIPPCFVVRSGWIRYVPGKNPEAVDAPLEAELVFDCEVLYKLSRFACMATAASTEAFYAWISPWLLGESTNTRNLVPLGRGNKIVIGHYVCYDRIRIKEEYTLFNKSTNYFIDTLSLHHATRGIVTEQQIMMSSIKGFRTSVIDISSRLTKDINKKVALLKEHGFEKETPKPNIPKFLELNKGKEIKYESPEMDTDSDPLESKMKTDLEILDKFTKEVHETNEIKSGNEAKQSDNQNQEQDFDREAEVSKEQEKLNQIIDEVEQFTTVQDAESKDLEEQKGEASTSLEKDKDGGDLAQEHDEREIENADEHEIEDSSVREKEENEDEDEDDDLEDDMYNQTRSQSRNANDLIKGKSWIQDFERLKHEIHYKLEHYKALNHTIKTLIDEGQLVTEMNPQDDIVRKGLIKSASSQLEALKSSKFVDWVKFSPLDNTLASLANLYCHISLDKSTRSFFDNGTPETAREQIQELLRYNAQDCVATHAIYKQLLLKYLEHHPHPASFGGLLKMSQMILPTTIQWRRFIMNCEALFQKNYQEIHDLLVTEANKVVVWCLEPEKYESDPWLKQLDWELTGLPTISAKTGQVKFPKNWHQFPNWARNLSTGKDSYLEKLSLKSREAPLILKIKYKDQPLTWLGDHGWGIDLGTKDEAVKFKHLKSEMTRIGDRFYMVLPNPGGPSSALRKGAGSPFSKQLIPYIETGEITSDNPACQRIFDLSIENSYWASTRKRISEQMVIWNVDHPNGCEIEPDRVGIIIPEVLTMGTVTRRCVEKTWLTASNAKPNRIGSELKALVQAPPGYCFVGADVDSEELWIAALIGDANLGIHGGTPFGWMTLAGSRKQGTDLHTRTANEVGVTRNLAKIFNYGRIYGAGTKQIERTLREQMPGMEEEHYLRAMHRLITSTKGLKENGLYIGGTESITFNALEKAALAFHPTTPFLGAKSSILLKSELVGRDFVTSRQNWIIQSSGVDYLHLLIMSMDYFIREYNIKARLSISIHDEIRYIAKKEDRYRCAMALQVSNLLVRSFFSQRMGIYDLPQSCAFFSAIDFDLIMRKEVHFDCRTPSQQLKVPSATALNISQLVQIPEAQIYRNKKKVLVPWFKNGACQDRCYRLLADIEWLKKQVRPKEENAVKKKLNRLIDWLTHRKDRHTLEKLEPEVYDYYDNLRESLRYPDDDYLKMWHAEYDDVSGAPAMLCDPIDILIKYMHIESVDTLLDLLYLSQYVEDDRTYKENHMKWRSLEFWKKHEAELKERAAEAGVKIPERRQPNVSAVMFMSRRGDILSA